MDDCAEALQQGLAAQELPRNARPEVAFSFFELVCRKPVLFRESRRRLFTPVGRRAFDELL
jgi:hypothetical protein